MSWIRPSLARTTQRVLRALPQTTVVQSRQFSATFTAFNAANETTATGAPVSAEEPTLDNVKVNKKRQRMTHYHPKVYEVSRQVRQTIGDAPVTGLSEAIDILQEGVSYLREVQQVEGIDERAINMAFQPALVVLFDKMFDKQAHLGDRTPEDVLALLVEHQVAHAYHFLTIMRHVLATAEGANRTDAYTKVLLLWIQYVEYSKMTETRKLHANWEFRSYTERGFFRHDINNLAFYAFVVHCTRTNTTFDLQTVMKFMQVDDPSRLPMRSNVYKMLDTLKLQQPLALDTTVFSRTYYQHVSTLDPNSSIILRRIEENIQRNDVRNMRALYQQIRELSDNNAIPLSEVTLSKVMNAFIELQEFDQALAIFSLMLVAKQKPSAGMWEVLFKALGHPRRLNSMLATERKAAIENIETSFRTMIANGVDVTPRVLGTLYGAFSNMNRQDLIEKYMAEFSNIPVIHLAKNNILIGMALNNKMADAEKLMRRYHEEDRSYTPSIHVINTFLAYYVKAGNNRAVEGLVKFMRERGIEGNVAMTTILVQYYFDVYHKRGLVPDIGELLSEVVQDLRKWDQQMVATLLHGLTQSGSNMDAARAVFRYFCKKDSTFKQLKFAVTTMLKAELDHGTSHAAEELLNHYTDNIDNTTRIWNMAVSGFLPQREDLAVKYYKKLCEQRPLGEGPNKFSLYYLLDHFVKTNNAVKIQWLLDELAASNLTDFGNQIPRMVRHLSLRFRVDPKLLEQLKRAN